ncbi:hypothetical protein [Polaribacter sp.]|uniref:hypothetical protein n=1 Tax=Polaribacter sp. TaxID=1920175 RepID=UPI0035C86B69
MLFIAVFTSCTNFSFSTKKQTQALDTIVNFSSVDTSPSFKVCDSLIAKEEKSNCFRNTIHNKIGEELLKHEFAVDKAVSEIVFVDLVIDSKGTILLKDIESSEAIKTSLPQLDSIILLSVNKIPKIYPAIKRGIPVTTKYRLPILIELKE